MDKSFLVTHNDRTKRVWNLVLQSSADKSAISNTLFTPNLGINRAATDLASKLHQHMQPGNRPCYLIISIYDPIDEEQSKNLNDRRAKSASSVANTLGTIVTGGLTPVAGPWVGIPAGGLTRFAILDLMLSIKRNWNSGDILITVDGKVNGGIGQPHSSQYIVISRNSYDKNKLDR
ncbi:hypothetical protein HWV03_10240 [Moritella sp. 36]|uniref:hypothetical protein n=1 Tax=Moritella sp. 36 TaxID=2746233 RepID=UPI001BA61BB0|nr:hypothetical protein [Moritella sp. 36]QUM89150.1 hypothetical protein HWV03_10240 [Moritella sp. 36]